MTSSEIMNLLCLIAETPGTNDKIYFLKEFLQEDDFRRVIQLAYDPYLTFGINKLDFIVSEPGDQDFDINTYFILQDLQDRTLTGNAAKGVINVLFSQLNRQSRDLFQRILEKDLKAGFHATTVNKAFKGLIPIPAYMRCSLPKETDVLAWPWIGGIISQEKLNGSFLNVISEDGISLMTRKGQFYPLEQFEELVDAIKMCFPNQYHAHGEMLVERNGTILDRSTGNGILNHVRQGGAFASNEKPLLNLWDIVPSSVIKKEKKGEPYAVRYQALQDICRTHSAVLKVIDNRILYSYSEALEHFKEVRAKGGEGTVIKHPYGFWQNTTSKFQVKVKAEKEADLRIIGTKPGKGKNAKTFGSLICITEDEKLIVAVSGFTDSQREEIYNDLDKYMYKIIPVLFTDLSKAKNSTTYSMENPRVSSDDFEVRTDKDEADTLDRLLKM